MFKKRVVRPFWGRISKSGFEVNTATSQCTFRLDKELRYGNGFRVEGFESHFFRTLPGLNRLTDCNVVAYQQLRISACLFSLRVQSGFKLLRLRSVLRAEIAVK